MRDTTILIIVLVTLGVLLLALAPQLSEMMVRGRARRLPRQLAIRMEEEWRGELNAIASRPGKLAFAIALMLTRRRAFVAPGEDSMTEVQDRPVGGFAVFGGWKTLLIVPTLVCAIAAGLASHLLPNRYASEAMLLVQPPDVSKDFVPGLYDVPIEERFEAFQKLVKSRNSLTAILNEFRELGNPGKNMDGKIEELRDDISIRLNSESGTMLPGASIVLRYVGYDPKTAQKVTGKLTYLLIQRDLEARADRVQGTNAFLETELQKLAIRVTEQGDRVARERAAHGPGAAALSALDYELLQSRYRTLFAKREEAKMALSLESNNPNNFQVVDSAYLPLEPTSPNRWAITGIGALVGFALGGMAVAGLYRRQRRVLA